MISENFSSYNMQFGAFWHFVFFGVDCIVCEFYYQRRSIASYANAGIARAEMSVCLAVCPFVHLLSVTLWYSIKTNVMISSPYTVLSRNVAYGC